MMQNRPVTTALKNYLQNKATEAELALLEHWAAEHESNQRLWSSLKKGDFPKEALKELDAQQMAAGGRLEKFWRQYADTGKSISPRKTALLRQTWWRYAAVFMLIAGGIAWYLLSRPAAIQPEAADITGSFDIAPGKEGAVLTLSNGRTIVLDSATGGMVAAQNGARLVLDNNRLAYLPPAMANGEMIYNTISTPKGRQFKIILSDGSAVWLNAFSSLRYPVVFGDSARVVEITGEAYFEVKQDARRPFMVKAGEGAAVEVLGTRFNVNAYPDEAWKNITLLGGSVRTVVERAGERKELILKPGQQAAVSASPAAVAGRQLREASREQGVIHHQSLLKLIENPDIEKVMAWKNGFFNFDRASLEEVMRQLSRWYDIEVVYEKGIPDIHFFGKMSRNINLSDLLRILEDSNIHFRMEAGRKLIVRP